MLNKKLILFVVSITTFLWISCANVKNDTKNSKKSYVKDMRSIVSFCKEQTLEDKVICRGLTWLFEHPVGFKSDGFLELGEELNLFYKLYLMTNNQREKEFYKDYILSRVKYLLNDYTLKVDYAGEITAYLNFAKIMKNMEIESTKFFDFIETDVLYNQMTYPPNVTYAILNSALIEDIGYAPKIPLKNLVSSGVIAHFSRNPALIPLDKAYASPDNIMNFFYDITHEIFALSSFGDRDPLHLLLSHEIEFLKGIISKGVLIYLEKEQVDILGELIICAKLLKFTDFDGFEESLNFILNAQKDDGSFGIIERMEYLGRPNVYRHGVLVSLWALIE